MAKAKSPIPEGFHTVTPQLILDNAAQAIDWYKKALGAEEVSRATGPDGKILHADLKIGNSHIMMNDAMGGAKGPKAFGGSPTSLWVYVADADALFNRAREQDERKRRKDEPELERARRWNPARWARYPISSGATAAARSTIRTATAGRLPRARKISRRRK